MRSPYRLRSVDHTETEIAEDIAELDRVIFFDGSPNLTPDNVSAGGHWWVAYKGDDAVGYCALTAGLTPGYGYLRRAGVLQDHRGNGLQTRMIDVRERKARALGLSRMVTDTAYFNTRSANNLIRRGYRLYKPEKPWSFETSLYWMKHLNPTGVL